MLFEYIAAKTSCLFNSDYSILMTPFCFSSVLLVWGQEWSACQALNKSQSRFDRWSFESWCRRWKTLPPK